MDNGYSQYCSGEPDEVIQITLPHKTVYHGVSEGVARRRKSGRYETIPGFWRRKK